MVCDLPHSKTTNLPKFLQAHVAMEAPPLQHSRDIKLEGDLWLMLMLIYVPSKFGEDGIFRVILTGTSSEGHKRIEWVMCKLETANLQGISG